MAKNFNKRRSLLFLSFLLLFSISLSVSITGSHRQTTSDGVAFQTSTSPKNFFAHSDSEACYISSTLLPVQSSQKSISTEDLLLYPGGMPFGIKFITEGVLITGFCDVKGERTASNPSADAGLKVRDVIISINGVKINDASQLAQMVESSKGKALTVEYRRGEENLTTKLTPVYSADEGKYKTGIYVRDSGAGIGTVTFIFPETLSFAGLGHGICDTETGKLIPIQRGSVVDVTINGVVKGLTGSPGEIKGYFNSGKVGTLLQNTECGVYGVFANPPKSMSSTPLPVAKATEIKEGDAYIYCTLSGNTVNKYTVKISDIRLGEKGNKCFVVKVTDPALLGETGGIIQGMSGSPIIQNGKLVGAVTHVLINDPTTGYGIFIENMLSAAEMPQARAA